MVDLLICFGLKKSMAAPKGHSGYGGGAPKGHPHYGGGWGERKFTQELFEELCDRMVGGESTNKIVKDMGVYWHDLAILRAKSEENEKRYRHARELLQEWRGEEIEILSDEQPRMVEKENGVSYIDNGWVNLQKLRIESRKYLMEKLAPKTYGQKIEDRGALALAGAIAGAGMMLSKMEDKLLGVRPAIEASIIDQTAKVIDE